MTTTTFSGSADY